MDFYNIASMYCWWCVNMIRNSPSFHFGNWRAMQRNHSSSSSGMCLAALPTSVNTISFGDTLRFSLPCNLFCLSIWWMSCLPALPHTLENASLRTLLKELWKRRQKASVFCKQFLLLACVCAHVCVCVCALESCHVSHWIIKCEANLRRKWVPVLKCHFSGLSPPRQCWSSFWNSQCIRD